MKRAMRRRKTWQRQTAAITAAMMAMSVGGIAYAMPQGEVIRSGKGEITRQDKDMTVNQDSKRLAIDWAGFDIANDERVTFRQPDRDSVALNRVVGDAASVIDGALSGNGHVYVINPNGVLFGKNASVDVGSLVASTARISDRDMTNFAGADGITMAIPEDSSAKVINAGTIRAEGGLVVLHAAEVENSGTITNPEGTTALAAARNLSLSADTAGKINFTVDGALAKAKALNSGMLKADGGYLVMTARSAGDVMSTVVNNTGTMEAKTLRQNEKGEILLDGGDNGVVELSGTIDASGMEAGQSAGSIKAIGAETHVKDGATLHATGAVDGGLIETSGDYLEIGDNVDIDAAGKTGKAGEWLLDPTEVIINNSGTNDSGTGTGTVHGDSNTYTSGTTYLKTSTIADILKKNNVKIQATDSTYHNADITLASALNVDETTAGENTLTLEAEESVNINANINATAPLNVVLNADTNRDDKGGVNINADIHTGGGSLTTGANGATFFGGTNSGENNRAIETSGGNVNIQNEARLQLNGGTLSINSAGGNSAGGNVNFARNVASMNKYEAFMDHDFVNGLETPEAAAWENMIKLVYGKDYTNSNGQRVQFIVDGKSKYESLDPSQKIKASNMLARIWELANLAATQNNSASDDPDGKNLDGQHLVTITDKYENSAAMAPARKISGSVIEYFTGGKETTKNPSASKVSGREFSWVTGPEKDQVFYITDGVGSGSDQNGMYTNWVRNVPTGNFDLPYYNEPNNNGGRTSQPYVAIGWTDQNGWDDVGNGAGTVHGFIRETELPNSALAINSGAGNVTVGTKDVADTGRLGSGEGTGLRNLSIETTTGNVKVLGSIYVHDNNANAAEKPANGNVEIATQGNVDVGQITADKKVEIATTGADKDVTVNGKIATDGLVSIEATDDITVHGIENGDKIRLISTNPNGDGAITLANNAEDGGALITTSDANDAVIIDARGADGSFKNLTTAEKAIDTDGNWKVYSASPDRDTFSTNLNSNTTARWHANSDGANDLDEYAATNDGNKYIFQVQPTVTVKADDQSKIYGDTADVTKYTTTATASFTGRNGEYSVSDARFTPAFQEGTLKDRYTGEIELSSEGVAEEKTRMDGDIDRTSSDNARPYFVINAEGENLAGKEGYAVTTADGTLEILRRDANISGTGTQTYGKSDISWTTTASNLKNNDQVGTVTIKEGSAYTEIQKGRTTADAGMYENSVAFGSILNEKGEDASINYNLTGTGTIKVDPATLTVYTKDIHKTYSDVDGVRNALLNDYYVKGEANGDSNPALRDSVTLTNTSNAIVKKNGVDRTADASTEGYAINTTDASTSNGNYRLVLGDAGKVYIDKANLTITTNGFEKVYGDVDGVQKALENAATITGLTNGDGESTITVNGKSYALITVDDGTTRTNNVIYNGDTKEYSGYDVNADLSTLSDELRDSIAKNYTIDSKTSTVGKGILKKKGVTLITSDIPTTYGQGNVIHDKLNTNLVDVDGLISWDKDRKEEIKTQLGVTVELTSRSPYKMVDGEPATDSEGNLYTNNVGSYSIITGYTPSGAQWSSTENPNNYEVTSAPVGLVRINPADLTVNVGNATTVYGTPFDTSKYTYSYENLVNGDTAAVVDADLKMSPKYTNTGDGTDGRATQDVGDYSLTIKPSSFNSYLKNYNVTNVLSGVSTVTRAPYTITVGNIRATYGDYKTLFTALKRNAVGRISGLTNGDQNKFDSTFTGTSEALHFDGKKWSTNNVNTDGYAIDPVIVPELQAALENNYELVLKDSGRVYLDKAKLQVNIGNAETVYGTPFDKNQYSYNYSTETGKSLVNGDTKESLAQGLGEIKYDNKAALDGTTTGRWTEDVGYDYPLTFTDETKGAFNALNNYNVSFVGGTASVTPAPLKVNREGYTTEYGTVLLEDA
ncbi:filamentous hemagglutinin N-terminal domain-containing protein, partial [Mitsuokella jalaludinii]|uniref:two-partner secretion domain-containing protein n=1 Tax=Mitsuokella jalaludinii TaxID=187979 RepID=UPI0022E4B02E